MVYLLLVSLVWAFSFPLMGSFRGIDPLLVAFLRLAIALPVFLPFLRFNKIKPAAALWLMGIGAVQYGLMYAAYIAAYGYLPAHQIAILTIFTPIFVTLLWDAQHRHINFFALGMAAVAVLGAGIIKYDPDKSYNAALIGFALMQLSNLCFAAGQLEYKRFRTKHDKVLDHEVYALAFVGAVICNGIATTISGGWADIGKLTPAHWQLLLYLGIVASGLCFFWWNKGAVQTDTPTLAVLNNVKIPLAVLVSLLPIFGAQANLPQLIAGGALMLGAGWACQWQARQKR